MIGEEPRIIDIIAVVILTMILVASFIIQMDTYLIRSDLRSIQRALDSLVRGAAKKRLTYKELTH